MRNAVSRSPLDQVLEHQDHPESVWLPQSVRQRPSHTQVCGSQKRRMQSSEEVL